MDDADDEINHLMMKKRRPIIHACKHAVISCVQSRSRIYSTFVWLLIIVITTTV